MKRIFSLTLMIAVLATAFALLPAAQPRASASTSLPDSVYLAQQTSTTCTLTSAVMAMRARAYLGGYGNWANITEAAVRSTAWTSDGLLWSFTYSFDGNYISVGHVSTSGISLSTLRNVLSSHPEGIVLYCSGNGQQHAVFITDIEGDTVYCADPAG